MCDWQHLFAECFFFFFFSFHLMWAEPARCDDHTAKARESLFIVACGLICLCCPKWTFLCISHRPCQRKLAVLPPPLRFDLERAFSHHAAALWRLLSWLFSFKANILLHLALRCIRAHKKMRVSFRPVVLLPFEFLPCTAVSQSAARVSRLDRTCRRVLSPRKKK